MIQKAEGTFYSAWHGAGTLPFFVGGDISRINDAWPNYPLPGGGSAGGSQQLRAGAPTFLGESGGLKTYEAEDSEWWLYNANNGLIFHAAHCKVTYRTQPTVTGNPDLIPEQVVQIDISGTDDEGRKFVAMTPRLQGPSAGFGKVDIRLVVADESTTPVELKREVREPIAA